MRDMAASVLTRLKKQAQETGLNYQMCLQLFCQEEFLLSQWKRFKPSMQMELPEFTVVLNRLHKFLEPVFDSSICDKKFFMKWSVDGEIWEEHA